MLDARQPNVVATLDTPQADTVLAEEARRGTVIDAKTVKHNLAWMRPNDLVYSYVVDDWLLGNDAPAFDGAGLERRRHQLVGHLLAGQQRHGDQREGDLHLAVSELLGTPIDLSKVTSDAFLVAGLRDHITTWRPCYMTSRLLGGDTEVVIVNSGHVQTFVNPAGKCTPKVLVGRGRRPRPRRLASPGRSARRVVVAAMGGIAPDQVRQRKARTRQAGQRRAPSIEPAPRRYVHEK